MNQDSEGSAMVFSDTLVKTDYFKTNGAETMADFKQSSQRSFTSPNQNDFVAHY